jgi:hypothetical protein
MAKGGALVVVACVAVGAYALGARQTPVPIPKQTSMPAVQPLSFASQQPAPATTTQKAAPAAPAPVAKQASTAPPSKQTEPPKLTTKQKVEVALTAAAIAAIIVQASRQAYYATGRPCACPDDTMRNGRACGSKSAYSRPGGAAPLCFVSDVPPSMIENYRSRVAAR